MKRIVLFISITLVTLLAGCATTGIDQMIPEETAMYLQIPDTHAFLMDVDGVLQDMGLAAMYQGMELEQFLDTALTGAGAPFSLESFDLERPAGFAILPRDADFDDVDFILFMPVSEAGLENDIAASLNNPPTMTSLLFKDYVVLFSAPEMAENFPPKKREDISILENYPDSSLQMYIDIPQLIDQMNLMADFEAEMEMVLGDQPEFIANIFDAYFGILNSVESMSMAMSTNGGDLVLSSFFDASGKTGRFIKNIEPAESLDIFPIVTAGSSSMLFALSISPETSADFTEALLETMEIDFSDEALADYRNYMDEMAALSTGRSSVAMDFHLNTEAPEVTGKKPAQPAPEIPFEMDVVVAAEVLDIARYVELYTSYQEANSEFMRYLLGEDFSEEFGDMQPVYISGATPGGREYQEMKLSSLEEIQSIMPLRFYITSMDSMWIMYAGTSGPEVLDSLEYDMPISGDNPEEIIRGVIDVKTLMDTMATASAGVPALEVPTYVRYSSFIEDGLLQSRIVYPSSLLSYAAMLMMGFM